jgi:hypothetical protein
MEYGNEYQFKKEIVEKAIENFKILELYEVNKSVDLENDLKKFRIKNNQLRKYIQQVNYIYYSGNRKIYAITTKTKYLDSICNQDNLYKNYLDAKDYLIKYELDYLIDSLELLFKNNLIYTGNVAEHFKTIDHLVKSINKQINIKI